MANLSSSAVEKKLLAFFFKPPYHFRLVSAGKGLFLKKDHISLSELAIEYISTYKQSPTKDTLRMYCSDVAKTDAEIDKYTDAIDLMDSLESPDIQEFDFLFKKAKNYETGRKIFDTAEFIKNKLSDDEVDFDSLRKDLLNKILVSGSDSENVKRGFIYDNVLERVQTYKSASSGASDSSIIKFGMESLDAVVKGMRKSFLSLIYSKTGGGKTRTAINIAYNNALAGRNVVYFTLEMAFDLFASCVDSRMAMVDSSKIIFGQLDKEEKLKYAAALKKQLAEKLNIWVVDIPMGATSMHIFNELEMYKSCTGLSPDLVIVDYASLVEPTRKYSGRSEKYDILFKELHEIARMHNTAMLTATQESRDASKADKNKKDNEDTEGVDNISASNFMAPHCEIVLRLKQTKFDRMQNRLNVVVDKCRYGQMGSTIPLVALWDKSYVGCKKVPGLTPGGVRLCKVPTDNENKETETVKS